MFKPPTFEFWSISYVAIGAAIMWCKSGKDDRRVYALGDFLERLIKDERFRSIIEFSVFVAIGCYVASGIVQPTNAAQSIAAGMGWTGLLSAERRRK